MPKSLVCLTIFLIIGFGAFAQKDTLFFNNGTVVIGEVKKIQLGVMVFDPADANDITVQLRKIKSIYATARDLRIETVDHQVILGVILPSIHPGICNVVLGSDTTTLALGGISNMYPVERSFWKKLNGNMSAGYSYTKSTRLGRLNVDASVNYLQKRSEVYLSYNSITNFVEDNSWSKDNENANARANFYFHPTWFAGVSLSYQRNLELGIKRRYQEGIGLGNKLITSRYVQLLLYAGPVINQELSTTGQNSGSFAEITGGLRFNVFRFEKPEIDIEVTQNGYITLASERYRYDGNVNIRWELINDLDLSISFYTNYDSKPPGSATENSDYGTVLGLAYTF